MPKLVLKEEEKVTTKKRKNQLKSVKRNVQENHIDFKLFY